MRTREVKKKVGLTGLLCAGVLGAAVWSWGQTPTNTAVGTAPEPEPAAAETTAPEPEAAEAAPTGEEADGETLSWRVVLENGGILMYVLAGVSVLTVALVVYLAIVLRDGQVVPRPLYRELIEKTRAGALDDVRRACEYRLCPLSHVVLAASEHVRNVPSVDPVMLKDIVEGEGSRQAESLQGQAQYLLDIAVISPMIGLLGTVFGMLKAFNAVALDIAQAKPIVLAGGVSQALITTAFGLIVGIPAMVFYAFFRRRASKVVSRLETASAEILTAMLSKSDR
mgnify:CR=1 FL=1